MLKETDSGCMFFYNDVDAAQRYIQSIFEKWQRDKNAPAPRESPAIDMYNRRAQTKKLAAILNDIT
jgi:hypothetical protein